MIPNLSDLLPAGAKGRQRITTFDDAPVVEAVVHCVAPDHQVLADGAVERGCSVSIHPEIHGERAPGDHVAVVIHYPLGLFR